MITTMRASCLAAALALAAFASPASGQTMEFGCPNPGTTFTYDSGVNVVARGQPPQVGRAWARLLGSSASNRCRNPEIDL